MYPETQPAGSESGARGSGDKTHWEIEKLKAETDHLRRPLHRSPAVLVPLLSTIVAAVVAVAGAGFKYQMNQLEAKRLEIQVVELQQQRDALVREVDAVQAEGKRVAVQLETTIAQLAEAQKALALSAASATSPEAKEAVTEAQSFVATLERATRESQKTQAAQSQRLNTLRSRIADSPEIRKPMQ